jgi:adenylylsulfate kinase-like enzyme
MSGVYWITGLSGAGKTTIGKALYEAMLENDPKVVFLDGDTLRWVLGDNIGYGYEDRKKCAMQYARLCKMLEEQKFTVICCTISMFDSVRNWNRENFLEYTEVYVKVSLETLKKRDQKGLYSSGEKNLMGIDLNFEEPKHPDIIIENDELMIEDAVKQILAYKMGRKKEI